MSTTECTLSFISAPDGARIHYRDTGLGKPVILIHGWAASGDFFEQQMALAARGLRLIVPDQRGHGASQGTHHQLTIGLLAADLRALIVHLGLTGFSLVGWSMGAMVAWEYLRQFGRIGLDKLSIVDMTPKIVSDDDWAHGLTGGYPAAMVQQTAQSVRTNWQRVSMLGAGRLFARNATPDPALLQQFAGIMRANHPDGLANLWIDMARQDYRRLLPTLGMDCQFIHGMESRLYRPETFAHLAQMTATTQLTGLADAGHVLQWEQPDAFGKALLHHLQH